LELLEEEPGTKFDVEEIKPAARSQGFRFAIVKTYAHRCTTCGIKILTSDGHTIVEAAHIVPFSISRNDDPRNGLCLCRSCHWSFDEGLIGVSAKYEVITSPQLTANSNLPSYIVTLAGRGIIHPIEEKFLPNLDNLAWHRKETFRTR
jgi:putative restriction endonuclease